MAFSDKIGYRQVAAATTSVKATPAGLYSVTCVVGGAVTVYDNASAGSGVILYTKTMTAGEVAHWGGNALAANNGLTVVSAGTVNVMYS